MPVTSGSAFRQIDFFPTGSVGIGSTNPTYELDIRGDVTASAYYGDGSNLTGISGSTSASFADYAMSASHALVADSVLGSITSASFADYAMSASHALNADNAISSSFTDYAMSASHADTALIAQNAYWTASGGEIHRMSNVGIGTTNPVDKLHVWGNVTASSFYGNGDNITGDFQTSASIWTKNSNDVYLRNATSEVVGIGTTNPVIKLHVWNSTDEMFRLSHGSTNGSPMMTIYQTTTRRSWIRHLDTRDILQLVSEYGDMAFFAASTLGVDSDTEYMRIQAGGNIGIGTTDPKEKLHVHGDSVFGSGDASEIRISGSIYIAAQSNTQPTVQIYNPAGYVDIVQQHLLYGFLVHRGTDWGGFGVTTGAIVQISSNTDTGDIQLCHNNFTDVRLHIDAGLAGFIGIGTTVPQAMLHVTGSGIFGGNVGIGTTDPSEKLEIYGANVGILVEGASGGVSDRSGSLILHGARDSSGEQGAFGRIYFTNADAGGAPGVAYVAIQAENVANDAGASILNFKTSDGSGVLTQAMTIDETQQVGIGTTNPVDKLHVWGNVTASNFYGNSANITGTVSASVFDSFGTYQMDSVDIIDTSGYQTGVLKTRQMLLFGRSASLSVDDSNIIVDAATVDGSLNGQGYRMLRAGTVSGVSVQCDVTDAVTVGSFTITVQKNAVNQSMTVVPTITSVGDTGAYSTSNSFTIVANDRINIEMDLDVIGETGAVENISIMVEILT